MSRWRYARESIPRNLAHYATAVLGIGLKLDPQLQPKPNMAETAILFGWWALWLAFALWCRYDGNVTPLLGFWLFWCSPLWATTLEPRLNPDMVFEYRSYLAVLGFAVMLSTASLYIACGLALIWAIQSWKRAHAFQSQRTFAEQALKENPQAKRPVINLRVLDDFAVAREIGERLAKNEPIPADLIARHNPIEVKP